MEYLMSCKQKTKLFFKKNITNIERKLIFEEIFDWDCLIKIIAKFGLYNEIYRLGDILFKVSKMNDEEKFKFIRRYLVIMWKSKSQFFKLEEDDSILIRSTIMSIKSAKVYAKSINALESFFPSFAVKMIVYFISNTTLKNLHVFLKNVNYHVNRIINNNLNIKEVLQVFCEKNKDCIFDANLLQNFPVLVECLTNEQKSRHIL